MHPKKLGRYELVSVLGKGAMGVVYEGRDPNLDRRVAIKTIMVDDLAKDAAAEYEARFRTEARSAARLQHPNIVSVYDSDRDGDTAYLVMEFVLGEDLKRHLDGGVRFDLPDALRLMQDLLSALDFAHAQGIVHRDVKPANLLIEPGGRLKLTDFGVARITGEATRTQGSMVGTLKYMAPEQVQGQKVDARADQFSAAVVAYQLFTGMRPFDGDNDFSIIHQIIGLDPAPPSTLVPGLPPEVDGVIARAMAKLREHRFGTAGEFQAALQSAFASGGVSPAAHAPLRGIQGATGALRPAPTVPGGSTAAGAPIAQELELEYWRDVRDATDPRELEGFLQRFPQGVYADLARRRLERLGVADPDPDRTVLQGFTGTSTRPVAPAGEPTVTLDSPPADSIVAAEPAADTSFLAAPPAATVPAPAQDASAPSRARSKAWLAPVALAVLATAGAALWMLQQPRSEASPQPAARAEGTVAAPGPAAASASVTPAAATAADAPPPQAARMASPAVAPAAAAPATAASGAAARPARRPSAPGGAATSGSTAAEPRGSAPEAPATTAAAASPAPAAVSPAPAPAARSTSPAETCKDRMLIARQLCLRQECAKPAFQRDAVCVKMREDDALREDSQKRF